MVGRIRQWSVARSLARVQHILDMGTDVRYLFLSYLSLVPLPAVIAERERGKVNRLKQKRCMAASRTEPDRAGLHFRIVDVGRRASSSSIYTREKKVVNGRTERKVDCGLDLLLLFDYCSVLALTSARSLEST